jgi:hypothetical protein
MATMASPCDRRASAAWITSLYDAMGGGHREGGGRGEGGQADESPAVRDARTPPPEGMVVIGRIRACLAAASEPCRAPA